ncbi:hypothetical protein [Fulvivirga lutimaris]|uniref:hypothetical protein n=1 Tax=Fulvivirga lutimaris TaxID=1819566 RepID=UPI0012BB855F|nr:hypothetical protein [Fulvivirga lutimaris]MTI41238.1 hypothetical protein [Fulvivirga lutimaris]
MSIRYLILSFILVLPISVSAQSNALGRGGEKGKNIESLDLKKDFDVVGKGLIKKSEVAGIVKGALHFKTITSDYKLVGKGQGRETAKAWAILEGVSETTLQEISDEFAVSFSKKIEALGIEMKTWEEVSSTDNFPKVKEKEMEKTKSTPATGLIEIKTANDGPHIKQVMGNPGIWGALAKVGKEFKGNAITYDINIDFARFDIDAKRWRSPGYGPGYDFVTTSAEANVLPQVGIEAYNGAGGFGMMSTNLTFVGKYGEAGTINLTKNIYVVENYATDIDSYQGQMPERMKRMFTFNTVTTGTFVIKADEQKYKQLVLEALDAYSDNIIKLIKTQIRK